jgi:hypothetical protein
MSTKKTRHLRGSITKGTNPQEKRIVNLETRKVNYETVQSHPPYYELKHREDGRHGEGVASGDFEGKYKLYSQFTFLVMG